MKIAGAVGFAALAAVGNMVFVFGQKKAGGVTNGVTFAALTAGTTALLALAAAPLMAAPDLASISKGSWPWWFLSGAGLFVTVLAFNLLYTRYGASHYILYAVMSILTTSILVGVVYFKEPFNGWHFTALLTALATIALFTIGSARARLP